MASGLHDRTIAALYHASLATQPATPGEPARHFKWIARAAKAVYGAACLNCGWDKDVTDVHHITPRSEGGTDAIENLVVLCPNCHRRADKGALTRERLRELTSAARGGDDQGAPNSDGEDGV